MPIDIKNKVTRLNQDDSYYYLGKEDCIDALNITHNAQEKSQDIINTNIIGNVYVPYNKPAGTNQVIGAKADVLRDRVFEFIWNSNDYHSIVIYDNATRTRTKLIENLTDTNDIDVLQFTRNNKILHVDIIYRGDDEGDLLFYTDGNVTPRKLNVKHIQDGIYTYIKVPFIELAKMPPINPVIAVYGTDATRNANSLRKKLVMATYRWSYDDFEKPTFTTYSKIPLPIGYYGSDNDIDSTKNNFITFTVETGDENVTDIEIAVRFNVDNTWDDFVLAISLNKEQLGIADNVTYDYLFYNDAIYPPLDVEEVTQLFDWVPKKAKSQCLPNGNVVAFGALTEGYDNYPISQLDVTITAANATNIPPDTDPPAITYDVLNGTFTFTVSGSVPTGTIYSIFASGTGVGYILLAQYTSIGGDTTTNVATGMWNYINTHYPLYAGGNTGNMFVALLFDGDSVSINIVHGTSVGNISTEKTWLWNANYIFGLAYKDEQGRIMPGVTTFVNPVDSDNDFLVTTPSFSLDSTAVQTPVISSSINHLPPEGAVTYAWVRRRMTYADFLMYETCDYQDPSDGFLYFCLANIEKYKIDNSQFIYGTAPIRPTSRIRIIAGITSGLYNGSIYNQDYEILGQVTRTLTGGSSPDDDRLFIKVTKPTTPVSPAYSVHMVVMVYTPMTNPTNVEDSVYYEWGEEYGIYTDVDGINYHRGMDQDQTAIQPATFTWEEGDVYFHQRTMYNNIVGTGTPPSDTVNIMDSNWSDFFSSAVNDNGRGLTIEVNARETYFPSTIRFSREYQQNTNINQTNRFVYLNFIDLDRSFGSILRMSIKDRYIRIGQQFKIGSVPIFNQISKDQAGSTLVAATDVLLNPVTYYLGDYGVGDGAGAWVDFNFSTYFVDTFRGIECRLSRDGIVPISILYKMNSWATDHATKSRNIYSAFDPRSNNRIYCYEEIATDAAYTLTFSEDSNSYESFLSYHPEFMCTLGSLLITYKNGDSWTHDSVKYNNFFGVQYPSIVSLVFNDQSAVKKKYLGIGYKSLNNIVWESPSNGDVATSTVNPQTGLQQISQIIDADYELEETTLTAAFNNDANSKEDAREALINGDFLGGNYVTVKFICAASKAASLINMSQPYITWIPSNRVF